MNLPAIRRNGRNDNPGYERLSLRDAIDNFIDETKPRLSLPWGSDARALAEIERNGMRRARQEVVDAQLRAFRARLAHIAQLQLFDDIAEVMDKAEQMAFKEPHRAAIYMQVAERVIEFKLQCHQIELNPYHNPRTNGRPLSL